MVATLASSSFSNGADWMDALSAVAFRVALVGFASLAGVVLLMPPRRELARQLPPPPNPPALLALLLAALFLLSLAQTTQLAGWWSETSAAIDEVIGTDPDPSGLTLIPIAIAFVLPVMAATTLLAYGVTTLLVTAARSDVSFRALAACVCLQGGLVVNSFQIRPQINRLGMAVIGFAESGGTAVDRFEMLLARHDVLAGTMNSRLLWLLGGYLVALALYALMAPAPAASEEVRPRASATGVSSGVENSRVTGATAPLPPLTTVTGMGSTAQATLAFNDSGYSVRPKRTLVESIMGRRYAEYEIQSIPPKSRKWFSWSWNSGILRQEPDGLQLIRVDPAGQPGRFLSRQYGVVDAASGATLGRLVPRGEDWEIADDGGRTIAYVLEQQSGYAKAAYIVRVGESEVCRLTWSLGGATVHSAELDVSFLPAADTMLDKALIMALAPILEQKARLTSEMRA